MREKIKKIIMLITTMFCLCSLSTLISVSVFFNQQSVSAANEIIDASAVDGGSGIAETDNGVGIGNGDKLASEINSNLGGNFYLTNDIDLAGKVWIPIGDGSNPFEGTLDGKGFRILNLTINYTSNAYSYGLFGYTKNATIKNITFVNVNITISSDEVLRAGTVAGIASYGTKIEGVAVENGSIDSSENIYTTKGALIGRAEGYRDSVIVDRCYSKLKSYLQLIGSAPQNISRPIKNSYYKYQDDSLAVENETSYYYYLDVFASKKNFSNVDWWLDKSNSNQIWAYDWTGRFPEKYVLQGVGNITVKYTTGKYEKTSDEAGLETIASGYKYTYLSIEDQTSNSEKANLSSGDIVVYGYGASETLTVTPKAYSVVRQYLINGISGIYGTNTDPYYLEYNGNRPWNESKFSEIKNNGKISTNQAGIHTVDIKYDDAKLSDLKYQYVNFYSRHYFEDEVKYVDLTSERNFGINSEIVDIVQTVVDEEDHESFLGKEYNVNEDFRFNQQKSIEYCYDYDVNLEKKDFATSPSFVNNVYNLKKDNNDIFPCYEVSAETKDVNGVTKLNYNITFYTNDTEGINVFYKNFYDKKNIVLPVTDQRIVAVKNSSVADGIGDRSNFKDIKKSTMVDKNGRINDRYVLTRINIASTELRGALWDNYVLSNYCNEFYKTIKGYTIAGYALNKNNVIYDTQNHKYNNQIYEKDITGAGVLYEDICVYDNMLVFHDRVQSLTSQNGVVFSYIDDKGELHYYSGFEIYPVFSKTPYNITFSFTTDGSGIPLNQNSNISFSYAKSKGNPSIDDWDKNSNKGTPAGTNTLNYIVRDVYIDDDITLRIMSIAYEIENKDKIICDNNENSDGRNDDKNALDMYGDGDGNTFIREKGTESDVDNPVKGYTRFQVQNFGKIFSTDFNRNNLNVYVTLNMGVNRYDIYAINDENGEYGSVKITNSETPNAANVSVRAQYYNENQYNYGSMTAENYKIINNNAQIYESDDKKYVSLQIPISDGFKFTDLAVSDGFEYSHISYRYTYKNEDGETETVEGTISGSNPELSNVEQIVYDSFSIYFHVTPLEYNLKVYIDNEKQDVLNNVITSLEFDTLLNIKKSLYTNKFGLKNDILSLSCNEFTSAADNYLLATIKTNKETIININDIFYPYIMTDSYKVIIQNKSNGDDFYILNTNTDGQIKFTVLPLPNGTNCELHIVLDQTKESLDVVTIHNNYSEGQKLFDINVGVEYYGLTDIWNDLWHTTQEPFYNYYSSGYISSSNETKTFNTASVIPGKTLVKYFSKPAFRAFLSDTLGLELGNAETTDALVNLLNNYVGGLDESLREELTFTGFVVVEYDENTTKLEGFYNDSTCNNRLEKDITNFNVEGDVYTAYANLKPETTTVKISVARYVDKDKDNKPDKPVGVDKSNTEFSLINSFNADDTKTYSVASYGNYEKNITDKLATFEMKVRINDTINITYQNPHAYGLTDFYIYYSNDTFSNLGGQTTYSVEINQPLEYDIYLIFTGYELTYNLTGGNIEGDTKDVVCENAVIYGSSNSDYPKVAIPTKANYQFAGWASYNQNVNFENQEAFDLWKSADEAVVYATFDANGNLSYKPYEREKDSTLYALWIAKQYEIVFSEDYQWWNNLYANETYNLEKKTEKFSQTKKPLTIYSNNLEVPLKTSNSQPMLSLAGYEFLGWNFVYTDSNNQEVTIEILRSEQISGNQINKELHLDIFNSLYSYLDTTSTNSITFVPKWRAKSYTFSYGDAESGDVITKKSNNDTLSNDSVVQINNSTVLYTISSLMPDDNAPIFKSKRNGYVFEGFVYTQQCFNESGVPVWNNIWVAEENLNDETNTVTASFVRLTYNIILKRDVLTSESWETGSQSEIIIKINKTTGSVTFPKIVRSDHIFLGWKATKDDSVNNTTIDNNDLADNGMLDTTALTNFKNWLYSLPSEGITKTYISMDYIYEMAVDMNAIWKQIDEKEYFVQIFEQQIAGMHPNATVYYTATPQRTEKAITDLIGKTLTIKPESYISAGFTFDERNLNNVISQTIIIEKGDIVFKLYYTRNQYSLQYRWSIPKYVNGNLVEKSDGTLEFEDKIYSYTNADEETIVCSYDNVYFDEYLSTYNPTVNPTLTGYTFERWNNQTSNMPISDLVIDAIINPNTYNIKYDSLMGEGTKNVANGATYHSKVYLNVPTAPERFGFVFKGWEIDKDNIYIPYENGEYTGENRRFDINQNNGSSINFYAIWETVTNKYKIILDANGGKYADGSTQKTYDFDFACKNIEVVAAPSRGGFVFDDEYIYDNNGTTTGIQPIYYTNMVVGESTKSGYFIVDKADNADISKIKSLFINTNEDTITFYTSWILDNVDYDLFNNSGDNLNRNSLSKQYDTKDIGLYVKLNKHSNDIIYTITIKKGDNTIVEHILTDAATTANGEFIVLDGINEVGESGTYSYEISAECDGYETKTSSGSFEVEITPVDLFEKLNYTETAKYNLEKIYDSTSQYEDTLHVDMGDGIVIDVKVTGDTKNRNVGIYEMNLTDDNDNFIINANLVGDITINKLEINLDDLLYEKQFNHNGIAFNDTFYFDKDGILVENEGQAIFMLEISFGFTKEEITIESNQVTKEVNILEQHIKTLLTYFRASSVTFAADKITNFDITIDGKLNVTKRVMPDEMWQNIILNNESVVYDGVGHTINLDYSASYLGERIDIGTTVDRENNIDIPNDDTVGIVKRYQKQNPKGDWVDTLPINAGTYLVKITIDETISNYVIPEGFEKQATLTITQREIEIIPNAGYFDADNNYVRSTIWDKTYDGSVVVYTDLTNINNLQVKNIVTGDDIGLSCVYEDANATLFSATNIAFSISNPNYYISSDCLVFSIAKILKRNLNINTENEVVILGVTVKLWIKTYDGDTSVTTNINNPDYLSVDTVDPTSINANNYQTNITGIITGDDIGLSAEYTNANVKGTDQSQILFKITNPNYEIINETRAGTIEPLVLRALASSLSYTFNGNQQAPDITLKNLDTTNLTDHQQDMVEGKYTINYYSKADITKPISKPSDAGEYIVRVSFNEKNADELYNIMFYSDALAQPNNSVDFNFVINKKKITAINIGIDNVKNYDGTLYTKQFTFDKESVLELIGGDTIVVYAETHTSTHTEETCIKDATPGYDVGEYLFDFTKQNHIYQNTTVSPNYDISETVYTGKMTIIQGYVDLSDGPVLEDVSYVYDGTEKSIDEDTNQIVNYLESKYSGHYVLSYVYETQTGEDNTWVAVTEKINVQNYRVTLTITSDSYNFSPNTFSCMMEITPRQIYAVVEGNDWDKKYDGNSNFEKEIEIYDSLQSKPLSEIENIVYPDNMSITAQYIDNYKNKNLKQSAGNAFILLTLNNSTENYVLDEYNISALIKKKEIVLNVSNIQKTYNGFGINISFDSLELNTDYTAEGLAAGEKLADSISYNGIVNAGAYTLQNVAGQNIAKNSFGTTVGTAFVTNLKVKDSSNIDTTINYDISTIIITGNVVVKKAIVGITGSDIATQRYYTGKAQGLTRIDWQNAVDSAVLPKNTEYSVSYIKKGQTIPATPIEAGEWTVVVTLNEGNFAFVGNVLSFTIQNKLIIQKAPVTIAFGEKTEVWNKTRQFVFDLSTDCTITGIINGQSLSSPASATISDIAIQTYIFARDFELVYDITDGTKSTKDNYEVTYTGTLTVVKADYAGLNLLRNYTVQYKKANIVLPSIADIITEIENSYSGMANITYNYKVNDENWVEGETTIPEFKEVGTYKIALNISHSFYNTLTQEATLTITKRLISVALSSGATWNKVYDGTSAVVVKNENMVILTKDDSNNSVNLTEIIEQPEIEISGKYCGDSMYINEITTIGNNHFIKLFVNNVGEANEKDNYVISTTVQGNITAREITLKLKNDAPSYFYNGQTYQTTLSNFELATGEGYENNSFAQGEVIENGTVTFAGTTNAGTYNLSALVATIQNGQFVAQSVNYYSNYVVKFDGTITIKKAQVIIDEVTIDDDTQTNITYDGQEHIVKATFSVINGVVAGDIEYKIQLERKTTQEGFYSLVDNAVDYGYYKTTFSLVDGIVNYEIGVVEEEKFVRINPNFNFVIEKKELTIDIGEKSVFYTDGDIQFVIPTDFSIDGLAGGHTLSGLVTLSGFAINQTYQLADSENFNIYYEIKQGAKSVKDNYDVLFAGSVTINPLPQGEVNLDEIKSMIYDGTTKVLTLSYENLAGETVIIDTIENFNSNNYIKDIRIEETGVVTQPINAGNYIFTLVRNGYANSNHTFTIQKRDIYANVQNATKVYDGTKVFSGTVTAQTLVNGSRVDLSTLTQADPVTFAAEYASVNAGTVTINVTLNGVYANYVFVNEYPKGTINPYTATLNGSLTKYYDGLPIGGNLTDFTPTVALPNSEQITGGTVTFKNLIQVGTNYNLATSTFTLANVQVTSLVKNYNFEFTGTATIQKAHVTIGGYTIDSQNSNSVEYNGKTHNIAARVYGVDGKGVVTDVINLTMVLGYSSTEGQPYNQTIGLVANNAGYYNAVFSLPTNLQSKYEIEGTNNFEFEITKKAITDISIGGKNFTFEEGVTSFTFESSDALTAETMLIQPLADGHSATITVTTNKNEVGIYVFTPLSEPHLLNYTLTIFEDTINQTANYDLENITCVGYVNIAKELIDQTITIEDKKVTYDGKPHSIDDSSVVLPAGTTKTYSYYNSERTLVTSEENPTFINSGSYTIVISYLNANYTIPSTTATLIIMKRTIVASLPDSLNKQYDGTSVVLQSEDITPKTQNGEGGWVDLPNSYSSVSFTAKYTKNGVEVSDAGIDYEIHISMVDTENNYTYQDTPATGSITPLEITLTPKDSSISKYYDGQTISANLVDFNSTSALPNGETITAGNVTFANIINCTTTPYNLSEHAYTITNGIITSNFDNYVFTFNGTAVVNKAQLEITNVYMDNQNITNAVYDDKLHIISSNYAIANGRGVLTQSQSLVQTLTYKYFTNSIYTVASSMKLAGNYKVEFTLTDAMQSNYTLVSYNSDTTEYEQISSKVYDFTIEKKQISVVSVGNADTTTQRNIWTYTADTFTRQFNTQDKNVTATTLVSGHQLFVSVTTQKKVGEVYQNYCGSGTYISSQNPDDTNILIMNITDIKNGNVSVLNNYDISEAILNNSSIIIVDAKFDIEYNFSNQEYTYDKQNHSLTTISGLVDAINSSYEGTIIKYATSIDGGITYSPEQDTVASFKNVLILKNAENKDYVAPYFYKVTISKEGYAAKTFFAKMTINKRIIKVENSLESKYDKLYDGTHTLNQQINDNISITTQNNDESWVNLLTIIPTAKLSVSGGYYTSLEYVDWKVSTGSAFVKLTISNAEGADENEYKNYTFASENIIAQITPRSLIYTLSSDEEYYFNNEVYTKPLSSFVLSGDGYAPQQNLDAGSVTFSSITNAGDYSLADILATLSDNITIKPEGIGENCYNDGMGNINYEISFVGNVKVKKAQVKVVNFTLDNNNQYEIEYDAQNHTINAQLQIVGTNGVIINGVSLNLPEITLGSYNAENVKKPAVSGVYKKVNDVKNAGKYNVRYSLIESALTNYEIIKDDEVVSDVTFEFEITKTTQNIDLSNQKYKTLFTKEYTEIDPTLEISAETLFGNTITIKLKRQAGEGVGQYDLYLADDYYNENLEITISNSTDRFVINKWSKRVDIVILENETNKALLSKVYDGEKIATVTNFEGEYKVYQGETEVTANINIEEINFNQMSASVGQYAFDSHDYTISSQEYSNIFIISCPNYEITKREIVFGADSFDKVYDGTTQFKQTLQVYDYDEEQTDNKGTQIVNTAKYYPTSILVEYASKDVKGTNLSKLIISVDANFTIVGEYFGTINRKDITISPMASQQSIYSENIIVNYNVIVEEITDNTWKQEVQQEILFKLLKDDGNDADVSNAGKVVVGEYEISLVSTQLSNFNLTIVEDVIYKINTKSLIVIGSISKLYDETTDVNIEGLGLQGIVQNDDVQIESATYASIDVGVHDVSFVISGADKNNYTVRQAVGEIEKRYVTLKLDYINGGSDNGVAINPQFIKNNSADEIILTFGQLIYNTTLPTPTHEGYNFVGWQIEYLDGEEQKTYTIVPLTTTISSPYWLVSEQEKTAHAVWEIKKYTLTLDNYSGINESWGTITIDGNATKEYNYGTQLVLADIVEIAPARGYDFVGFYNSTNAILTEVLINDNMTIYWKFAVKSSMLLLNVGIGGWNFTEAKILSLNALGWHVNGNNVSKTFAFFDTVDLSPFTPTKNGYRFTGWTDGENSYVSGTTWERDENLIITASYQPLSSKVILETSVGYFDVEGKDDWQVLMTDELTDKPTTVAKVVYFDSEVGDLLMPVVVGYDFLGWIREGIQYPHLSLEQSFVSWQADRTYIAIWRESQFDYVIGDESGRINYDITIKNSDGETLSTMLKQRYFAQTLDSSYQLEVVATADVGYIVQPIWDIFETGTENAISSGYVLIRGKLVISSVTNILKNVTIKAYTVPALNDIKVSTNNVLWGNVRIGETTTQTEEGTFIARVNTGDSVEIFAEAIEGYKVKSFEIVSGKATLAGITTQKTLSDFVANVEIFVEFEKTLNEITVNADSQKGFVFVGGEKKASHKYQVLTGDSVIIYVYANYGYKVDTNVENWQFNTESANKGTFVVNVENDIVSSVKLSGVTFNGNITIPFINEKYNLNVNIVVKDGENFVVDNTKAAITIYTLNNNAYIPTSNLNIEYTTSIKAVLSAISYGYHFVSWSSSNEYVSQNFDMIGNIEMSSDTAQFKLLGNASLYVIVEANTYEVRVETELGGKFPEYISYYTIMPPVKHSEYLDINAIQVVAENGYSFDKWVEVVAGEETEIAYTEVEGVQKVQILKNSTYRAKFTANDINIGIFTLLRESDRFENSTSEEQLILGVEVQDGVGVINKQSPQLDENNRYKIHVVSKTAREVVLKVTSPVGYVIDNILFTSISNLSRAIYTLTSEGNVYTIVISNYVADFNIQIEYRATTYKVEIMLVENVNNSIVLNSGAIQTAESCLGVVDVDVNNSSVIVEIKEQGTLNIISQLMFGYKFADIDFNGQEFASLVNSQNISVYEKYKLAKLYNLSLDFDKIRVSTEIPKIYIYIVPIEFEITFDYNTGIESQTYTAKIKYGTSELYDYGENINNIVLPPDTTEYTYGGWGVTSYGAGRTYYFDEQNKMYYIENEEVIYGFFGSNISQSSNLNYGQETETITLFIMWKLKERLVAVTYNPIGSVSPEYSKVLLFTSSTGKFVYDDGTVTYVPGKRVQMAQPLALSGFVFNGWRAYGPDGTLYASGNSSKQIVFTMPDFDLSVIYDYNITISISSLGQGNVSPDNTSFVYNFSKVYYPFVAQDETEYIKIYARANAGYEFSAWRIGGVDIVNNDVFKVTTSGRLSTLEIKKLDTAYNISAVFVGQEVTLTFNKNEKGFVKSVNGTELVYVGNTATFISRVSQQVRFLFEPIRGYTFSKFEQQGNATTYTIGAANIGGMTFNPVFTPLTIKFNIKSYELINNVLTEIDCGSFNSSGCNVNMNANFDTIMSFNFAPKIRYAFDSKIYLNNVEILFDNGSCSIDTAGQNIKLNETNQIKVVFIKTYWIDIASPLVNNNMIYFEGDGIASDPFLLTTGADLAMLSYIINHHSNETVRNYYASAYYRLNSPVLLQQHYWQPIGTQETPFNGTFDFSGYGVGDIYLDKIYDETYAPLLYKGLFWYVTNDARFIEGQKDFKVVWIVVGSIGGAVILTFSIIGMLYYGRKRKFKKHNANNLFK